MKNISKLEKRTLELARKANFVFWKGEEWGPGTETVDWSCDYDREIVELVRLTVKECAELSNPETRIKILTQFGLAK